MKKIEKNIVVGIILPTLAVFMTLAVLGCASNSAQTGNSNSASSNSALNGVLVDPNPSRIIDWQGRTADAPPKPEWAKQVALENHNEAAIALGYGDGMNTGGPIYRGFVITGPNVRGAEMIADTGLARTVAKELQTQVNSYAAQSSTMNQSTKDMIKEITETRTQVTLSGYRQVGSFWQSIETQDLTTKARTRNLILFRLYRFDAEAWRDITAGYVQQILDKLPVPMAQREVDGMLTNALQNARTVETMTIDERKKQIEYEDFALRAQLQSNIAKDAVAQRQAGQQALAQIAADRDRALSQEVTARTGTMAEAGVQKAYADPITARAASTTAADAPLVNAAKLAAKVIF